MIERIKIYYYGDAFINDENQITEIGLLESFDSELTRTADYLLVEHIEVWSINDIPDSFLIFIKLSEFYNSPNLNWIAFIPEKFSNFSNFVGILETIKVPDGYLFLLM